MAQADIFVITTNLQFAKGEGWQRRHKIKTQHGDQWLTVPVHGSQNQMIKEVMIDTTIDWRRKHTKAIAFAYSHTPEKKILADLVDLYYQAEWERLVALNVALITFLRASLGLTTSLVLDEDTSGRKEQLLTKLCKKYGADTYLAGQGGKAYMTPTYLGRLQRANIACRFVEQDLTSLYPYSTIHYLLTEGRSWVQTLLR